MARHLRSLLAAAIAGILGLVACTGRGVTLAITHVTLIDVAGGPSRADMTVLVADRHVRAIGASETVHVPRSATVVDGRGRYLIPGLWDMHTHALWDPAVRATFFPLFVANGVTGIRDMGAPLAEMLTGRADVRTGRVVGPRIVAAGPILDGPHPVDPTISMAIGESTAARLAVDSLARAGVDFIKVYTLLPRDAFYSVIAAARRHGLPVAGHVPAAVTPVEAAEAGMKSVEHLRSELGGLCDPTVSGGCDSVFAAFRTHGTWNTPTLAVRRASGLGYDDRVVDTTLLRYMPPIVRGFWERAREDARRRTPVERARLLNRTEGERRLASAVHAAGLPLLAGTDAGDRFAFPGFTLHDELALLIDAGLSPLEALQTATLNPATYFDAADSLGAIAPGKLADLVLLDGDPLVDIHNTRRVAAVVLNGVHFDRAALDRLLSEAAAHAQANGPGSGGRERF
jgi:imidazolonepropionase-like amidohydrolase